MKYEPQDSLCDRGGAAGDPLWCPTWPPTESEKDAAACQVSSAVGGVGEDLDYMVSTTIISSNKELARSVPSH